MRLDIAVDVSFNIISKVPLFQASAMAGITQHNFCLHFYNLQKTMLVTKSQSQSADLDFYRYIFLNWREPRTVLKLALTFFHCVFLRAAIDR